MKTSGNHSIHRIASGRATHQVVSPVTGKVMEEVTLANEDEIREALAAFSGPPPETTAAEVFGFLERLRDELQLRREALFQKTVLETGFIASDCRDIVDGAIEFLGDFETFAREGRPHMRQIPHSYSGGSSRDMRITHRPYRCVSGVVPQNASLTLSITILAAAFYAGSRVVIRPSLQSAATGLLLADAMAAAAPPGDGFLSLNSLASAFIDGCCASESVDLLHYIGSNQFAPCVLSQAFAAGKTCLVDGQGNGLLYVDDSFPLEEAIEIITTGATRFNGETCTSVNGVLIEETIYDALRDGLIESFRGLKLGHPFDAGIHLGPLFSEKQARGLETTLRSAPGATVLCGGHSEGAYFAPAILEGAPADHPVVRQGFFGPAVWIAPVKGVDEACHWLSRNHFPLSDTVLSHNTDVVRRVASASRAARICINADPSVESMFEPWGGYPPSGLNPVSVWCEKYRQTYQLDGRLQEILAVSTARNEG